MGKLEKRYLIGIDEAGRGPLAGPVSVGAVCLPINYQDDTLGGWQVRQGESLPLLRDSKKLSAKQREAWWQWLKEEKRQNRIHFAVALVGNKYIDKRGIMPATCLALRHALSRLKLKPKTCQILLDGNLRAPKIFTNQQTIIRGDQTEPAIMLAAILAKVTRDQWITRQAANHPNYELERHKGYGTARHYQLLAKYGPSPLHRLSFLPK